MDKKTTNMFKGLIIYAVMVVIAFAVMMLII